jgi:23S rRNA pseudouridine1911/1915/1917 synthase
MGGVSLVRIAIGTGRTHQIRVHLSEAGYPVVGDELYGGVRRSPPPRLKAVARLGRPFLHAASLTVTHPATTDTVTFTSPLPPDLADLVSTLRSSMPAPASAKERS